MMMLMMAMQGRDDDARYTVHDWACTIMLLDDGDGDHDNYDDECR